jgi:hypothetical protein
VATKLHFHIRWSTRADLDWQAFDTIAEANSAAAFIVLPGETYVIEETGEACSRCAQVRSEIQTARPESPDARRRGAG